MPAFDNVAFNRDAHRLRAWIRGQDPTIVTSEESPSGSISLRSGSAQCWATSPLLSGRTVSASL